MRPLLIKIISFSQINCTLKQPSSMAELSREQKKMMQLIALIEKQDQEQKRKLEKKKQQVCYLIFARVS